MKRKSSIALIAIKRIISFVLVFIFLCSVSCTKDESAEFNKNIQPGSTEKASQSWKKVIFSKPEESEESDRISESISNSTSDETNNEESTASTDQTTTNTTDETTATSETSTPTTQTATTAPPTTASTTVNQGKYSVDQIVGEWESYVTVDYYSEKYEPDVLDNIWSEEIVFSTTIKHLTGNKYTISLTPVKFLVDYEETAMDGLRPGPLTYQAEVKDDVLSFSLESEVFSRRNGYEDGFVKPLDIEILLDEGEHLFGLVYITEKVKIEGLPSMVKVSFYITKYIST